MASREQLAEAACTLAPLRQGDLDGLCGLYAVLNAVRLVIHPFRTLRAPELKRLFEVGLASLARSRRLRRSIISGIVEPAWLRLCDEVVFEASVITGLEMFATPLFEAAIIPALPDALRTIRHSLRDGWPVLIALMDSLNHRSVIAGFSRTQLTLFDSSGHSWVWMRSLSFDPAKLGEPHFVPVESVVALLAF